jgi:hypothetical protein
VTVKRWRIAIIGGPERAFFVVVVARRRLFSGEADLWIARVLQLFHGAVVMIPEKIGLK